MGFEIKKPLGVGGVSSNINISNRVAFGNLYATDSFQTTSVNRYLTEDAIKRAIASNPNIKTILKEEGIPAKLNFAELQKLNETHAKATQDIAAGIIANLPKGLKERVNVKSVKDAALLHDVGKVLIPTEILNKPGKLDEKEQKIMHRHSELGYEILKNTDIDTRTLYLVKYHHQNMSHSGYPAVKSDFFADVNLQILSASDKYSALTEERPYKTAMDPDSALAIIYKDVKDGNLHPFVFKALYDFVKPAVKEPAKTLA
ncbi:MAG: HD domain-containing protein [Cyanobacteria bacterium SIG32]|nr:HD domain-containing protein [Cyanobacteria bacterium SIG32]